MQALSEYIKYLVDGTKVHSIMEQSEYESFQIEVLDHNKFIKVNDVQEVDDPVFFNGPTPSTRGLLSNEIFGITKQERNGIFAYISLNGHFMNPVMYKALKRINNKIEKIVHGTHKYKIDSQGELVEDENGNTGIEWLYKNFDKLKFKPNGSFGRDQRIKFIKQEKDKLWIDKFVIMPAGYRDVESSTSSGNIGVGEINKIYSSLIISARSIKETAEYGVGISDTIRGRLQETLLQVYDWCGKGTTISGQKTPGNLPGKTGLIKKGLLYKTIDYSTRLVMSAPELKYESIDDIMVDMNHAGLPLSSALVNFKPFVLFWLRRFFENEFAGKQEYTVIKNGKEFNVPLSDYQIMYSDVELEKQIENFVFGYSDRLKTVKVPVDMVELAERAKKDKNIVFQKDGYVLNFKGYNIPIENISNDENKDFSSYPVINRNLTWCDLFYIAVCEMTKDKHCLITRFPIDKYLNQFPSKIRIKSTIRTIPVVVNGVVYKWYPNITQEMIGKNTASMFNDTLSICNGLINGMGLDYDGDTAIVKPVYTVEANEECDRIMNSNVQVIGFDGKIHRDVSKECIQSLYSMTLCPDPTVKFVDPVF